MIKEHHIRLHHRAVPADLMLPKDDHDQACLARRRQYKLGKLSLWIISPEDFVLHKLKAGRAHDFIDVLSRHPTPSRIAGPLIHHRLGKATRDLGRVAVRSESG